MAAEICMILNTRREKKDGVYPIKLRVYYQSKTVLYPTVFNFSQTDYDKLDAKRTGERITNLREKLNDIVKAARACADDLHPFDFPHFIPPS